MDSRKDEQEREITMKTSAISLIHKFEVTNNFSLRSFRLAFGLMDKFTAKINPWLFFDKILRKISIL